MPALAAIYLKKAGPSQQVGGHTMLYGNWRDDFLLEMLSNNYPIAGVDYEIVGDLTDAELKSVTDCFSTSATVKRKYKKWLQLP
jgi:hypothetical protein